MVNIPNLERSAELLYLCTNNLRHKDLALSISLHKVLVVLLDSLPESSEIRQKLVIKSLQDVGVLYDRKKRPQIESTDLPW